MRDPPDRKRRETMCSATHLLRAYPIGAASKGEVDSVSSTICDELARTEATEEQNVKHDSDSWADVRQATRDWWSEIRCESPAMFSGSKLLSEATKFTDHAE